MTTTVPNVLVIERSRLIRDLLIKDLTAAGFAVDGVDSVEAAAPWLTGTARRVVILNRDIPNARAFEESIRTNISIKVIVLSSSGELDPSERALVDSVLDNSARLTRLIGLIRAFLRVDPPRYYKGHPILIMAHEAAIRDLLHEFFVARGYAVLLAASADELYQVLQREKKIGVALLDVTLPAKGGMEILEHITAVMMPDCPVILMSTQGDAEISKVASRLDAFDYVFKPLDLPLLEGLIGGAITQNQE